MLLTLSAESTRTGRTCEDRHAAILAITLETQEHEKEQRYGQAVAMFALEELEHPTIASIQLLSYIGWGIKAISQN